MYQGGRSKSLNLRGDGVWIGGLAVNSSQNLAYETLASRHGSIGGLQGIAILAYSSRFILTIMMKVGESRLFIFMTIMAMSIRLFGIVVLGVML